MNPGINYPITAYEPGGVVRSIPEGPKGNPDLHLKEYFNDMEAKGYHPDVNKLWGWERDPATGHWSVEKPNLDAKTASGELPPEWGGKDLRPEAPKAAAPHPEGEGGTYDYKTDIWADEPDVDPAIAALKAGVTEEQIARVSGIAAGRAPELGEHTDEILRGLGYDAARIATLRRLGVIAP